MISVMVSFWAAVALALPVILWQMWAFFAPAVSQHAQRRILGFVLFATGLFVAGLAFGYFVALPAAVHFLTNYDSDQFNILIRARDYYNFVLLVLIAVGVVFLLPIFVLALARLGILPPSKLRRNRRIGYVVVAAIAVALPGVDPVTTTMEMIPLMVLFELSIWLAVFFDRRWKQEADRAEAAEPVS
jgi:sec-independent protein translocase protein TatC